MIWEELNQALILTNLQADNSMDALKKVGEAVIDAGYAKESYADALIHREREYPTGLDVDGFGVAIPHTDVSHVCKAGIAIAVLEKPVTFVQMGTDDETVKVQLVFMLLVVDPNAHIDQLQRILEIIKDKRVLEQLLKVKNKEQIIEIIKKKENSL